MKAKRTVKRNASNAFRTGHFCGRLRDKFVVASAAFTKSGVDGFLSKIGNTK